MKTGESSGFVSSTEKESSVWLDFPGNQILQATQTKYRKKPILLEMVLNFDASYEELDKPLFHSDRDGVWIMWEYINMSFQEMSIEILEACEDFMKFWQVTLAISEKEEMITLFRKAIEQDVKC